MNTIYLLSSWDVVDAMLTDKFATDEEGLKRIARDEYGLDCGLIVVDMAAGAVRVMDRLGNLAQKYYIWTIARSV